MRIKKLTSLSFIAFCLFSTVGASPVAAQTTQEVTHPFLQDWYVMMGADMTLLNPYGHDFKNTFPNGKAFGIDVGMGKWFSPVMGVRGKVKWGNGILNNDHALWYRPYGEPNGNHRNGGFVVFSGDIMLNLHNLFGEYKPDRKWNLAAAINGGGWVDCGDGKGAPMLGAGVINTYRLNDRWSLYADASYHFISSVNDVFSGNGKGSNGYVEISVGAQLQLGKASSFKSSSAGGEAQSGKAQSPTVIPSFWSNWFAQAGLGMVLHNPCHTNFANVFPNGKTLGINIGVGKWFTDQIGLRGGLNWQNGIVGNSHASYLDPEGQPGGNHDEHGTAHIYADVFFNLHNIIGGYDDDRTWNAIFFPRMGVAKNFSSSFGECPIVGIGTEHTFRLTDRMNIFADVAYQVSTSGFLDDRFYTGNTGPNSNGWFDINIGVQYNLGRSSGKFVRAE